MWGVDLNFCSGLQPCKDPTVGMPHRRHGSPAGMRDAHLGDRWLLSDSRETQVFILPRLFLFLSLLLNCSLTKGLINSYAGQLKHVGCDRFCSTDSEEVQKAAPNRGKDTFPLAFWSCPKRTSIPRVCDMVRPSSGNSEEEEGTFLETSRSVHPHSRPGLGQGKLSLVTQIEISSAGPENEKPSSLCRALTGSTNSVSGHLLRPGTLASWYHLTGRRWHAQGQQGSRWQSRTSSPAGLDHVSVN